jgi:hypothetical protein
MSLYVLKLEKSFFLGHTEVWYIRSSVEASRQCCGSGMFITDLGSKFFHPGWIPDPRSKRIRIPDQNQRIEAILTKKMVYKLLDPDLYILLILDPGSRIRNTAPSPPI